MLEGKVTKVVSFGAFVEIMEGVEGLVHISELAQHHVENPREIVDPGDDVKVKILEIDDERRRLSLSLKRVEGQVLPCTRASPTDEEARRRARQSGEAPARGPRKRSSLDADAPVPNSREEATAEPVSRGARGR